NYSFKRQNNEISVKESVGLKIQSKNRCLSTSEFLQLIREFQKLIFILGNTNTKLDKILLTNDHERDIELFTKDVQTLGIPDMVNPSLAFNDLLPNITTIMSNWLENKEIHTSIDLILEKSINSKLSIENHFLNSC